MYIIMFVVNSKLIQREAIMMQRAATIIVVSLLLLALGSYASDDSVLAAQAISLTASDVADFFDDAINQQLDTSHVVSAAVAVVEDGELVFTNGYGYANLAENVLATPDETVFRIGSVSKMFVWVAVLQLVEQGKLDLDADINLYLTDFHIPDTFPQSITLTHLMTHTAGFEERILGYVGLTEEQLQPLAAVISDLPTRMRPPGEMISYSNYGAALTAYIVEQVSGMPFAHYVQQNIFTPLHMTRSTFAQPLPSHLAPNMAVGYSYDDTDGSYQIGGAVQRGDFEYLGLAPSAAMSSTAEDMGKFVAALLEESAGHDVLALGIDSFQQQFTNDARLDGFAYGLFEYHINGQYVLRHGGNLELFDANIMLLPDHNLGFFSVFSGSDATGKSTRLLLDFMDHFYPDLEDDQSALKTLEGSQERANRVAGFYASNRRDEATFDEFGWGLYEVTANPDGTIEAFGIRHIEIEPLVFRAVNRPGMLIFQEDEAGNITYMLSAYSSFERLSRDEIPRP
ncbi:MAG: beta-lactamase family protein [Anaerolineae bacterium]|nr:beta-lactamase family protein [Anaerolineae bacterium]